MNEKSRNEDRRIPFHVANTTPVAFNHSNIQAHRSDAQTSAIKTIPQVEIAEIIDGSINEKAGLVGDNGKHTQYASVRLNGRLA